MSIKNVNNERGRATLLCVFCFGLVSLCYIQNMLLHLHTSVHSYIHTRIRQSNRPLLFCVCVCLCVPLHHTHTFPPNLPKHTHTHIPHQRSPQQLRTLKLELPHLFFQRRPFLRPHPAPPFPIRFSHRDTLHFLLVCLFFILPEE